MLSRCREHPLNVPIERWQHTDVRVHQEVAAFSGADQATDCRLPFLEILFSLR
jgi:hypothetical protein